MNTTTKTLVPATANDVQRMLDHQREEIDRQWINRLERFAKRLERIWQQFSEDIEAVNANDLPAEEMAPLFATFAKLRSLGVRFDPRFIAKMDDLQRNMVDLNIDGDTDTSDELLDREDDDEDGSDDNLCDGFGDRYSRACLDMP